MIQHLFTTPVYSHTLAPEKIQLIAQEINQHLPMIRKKDLKNPWYDNMQTTFKYGDGFTNDLNMHNLNILKGVLFDHVSIYLNELNINTTCQVNLTESWFNFGGKGTYQAAHRHPLSTLSAVYYHQTNTEDGKICFLSPCASHNSFPLWESTDAIGTKDSVVYSPQVGMIIIFPSYLLHSVRENKTDHERISIAANFVV